MEIVNLNLIPDGPYSVAHTSQNDEGRTIRCKLFDGPSPYKLSGSESLELRIRQSDGTPLSIEVTNTSDDYVDVDIPASVTSIAGKTYCKLIMDNIGFKAFYLFVEKQP